MKNKLILLASIVVTVILAYPLAYPGFVFLMSRLNQPDFKTRPCDDGVEIIGYEGEVGEILVIPRRIHGRQVSAIGDSAFEECDLLISVKLPKGLQTIGESAFAFCYKLKYVEFSEGLRRIEDEAFSCAELTSVVFPESLLEIGDKAFFRCESLTSVEFPKGLQTIGEEAFCHCSSLPGVVFPGV